MTRKGIILVILAASLSSSSISAQGRHNLPPDFPTIAVLITLDKAGTASGFYLNDGKHVYLVTARHVLFNKPDLSLKCSKATFLSYSGDPADQKRIRLEVRLDGLHAEKLIRFHPSGDVAVVRVATFFPNGKGQVYTKGKHVRWLEGLGSPISTVSNSYCRRFQNVRTSSDVYVVAYPGSIGMKTIPQIEYDRPLLRKGIVAGKNKSKETIILDCPVYPGNSGAPVAEGEEMSSTRTKFRVIGVVSQRIPFMEPQINTTNKSLHLQFSNSGYCVVTPMDKVLELLWKPAPPPEPTIPPDKK